MAVNEFDEAVQHVNVAGTEQKIYEAAAGEVAIVQKLAAINTDTSTNCVVNVWISPSGGTTPAQGDVDHYIRDYTLAGGETKVFSASGRKIPAGGTVYVDVETPTGGNFQSSVNFTLSGVIVTQSRAATGTSA